MKPQLTTDLVKVYISDERNMKILERVRYWERQYRFRYAMATSPASWWSDKRIARQFELAEQAADHVVDLIRLFGDILPLAVAEER